jgi:hypothetical protein
MAWALYDYRDYRGRNPVKEWCELLQKSDLAKMNLRIERLEKNGHELCPGLASNLHGFPHLYKIKVNGSVAARLFLCKGPINMEIEYTLLLGAFEKDDALPEGTLEAADDYRKQVIANPHGRRGPHERPKK